MKSIHLPFALWLLLSVACAATVAKAQNAPLRAPAGGFDRPLSTTPRMGNPGASPKLTAVEFKSLLAHWADYDANKNHRFDKTEAPELFAMLFDQADTNHDGALDEKERAAVGEQPVTSPSPAAAKQAQPPARRQARNAGFVIDPLRRAVFGGPAFGPPPVPSTVK